MKKLLTDISAGLIASVLFTVITVSMLRSAEPGLYLPLYIGLELFVFIFFGLPGAGLIASAASVFALGIIIVSGSTAAILSAAGYWACLYILNSYHEKISEEAGLWNLSIENMEKEIGDNEIENSNLSEIISSLNERLERYDRLAEFAIRLSTMLDYEKLYTYTKKFLRSIFRERTVKMINEPDDCYSRWVFEKKQSLLVPNLSKDYRFGMPEKVKTASLIECPIMMENKVTGIIRVESESERFTSQDLRLLNSACSLSAIALENIRLFIKTQELAIKDGLTGLYTHSYFKERLNEEVERAARYKEEFSVIMMDLDNFKAFNDTYGHLAGDEVLVRVAQAVQVAVRDTDIVGRYGGEEMCVLLRNIAVVEAGIIAERIRSSVEACDFRFNSAPCSVTATLGMASFPGNMTAEEIFRAADRALYAGKEQGRNVVVISRG